MKALILSLTLLTVMATSAVVNGKATTGSSIPLPKTIRITATRLSMSGVNRTLQSKTIVNDGIATEIPFTLENVENKDSVILRVEDLTFSNTTSDFQAVSYLTQSGGWSPQGNDALRFDLSSAPTISGVELRLLKGASFSIHFTTAPQCSLPKVMLLYINSTKFSMTKMFTFRSGLNDTVFTYKGYAPGSKVRIFALRADFVKGDMATSPMVDSMVTPDSLLLVAGDTAECNFEWYSQPGRSLKLIFKTADGAPLAPYMDFIANTEKLSFNHVIRGANRAIDSVTWYRVPAETLNLSVQSIDNSSQFDYYPGVKDQQLAQALIFPLSQDTMRREMIISSFANIKIFAKATKGWDAKNSLKLFSYPSNGDTFRTIPYTYIVKDSLITILAREQPGNFRFLIEPTGVNCPYFKTWASDSNIVNVKSAETTFVYSELKTNHVLIESAIYGSSLPTKPISVSPNPFNQNTTIRFYLAKCEAVSLSIVDIRGRIIPLLNEKFLTAGLHKISFNSQPHNLSDLSSGVYFIQLTTGNKKHIDRAILKR